MASKTSVELGIKGVDQTRGVFATIRARMQALGARLRIVAAGIAQGFKRLRNKLSLPAPCVSSLCRKSNGGTRSTAQC